MYFIYMPRLNTIFFYPIYILTLHIRTIFYICTSLKYIIYVCLQECSIASQQSFLADMTLASRIKCFHWIILARKMLYMRLLEKEDIILAVCGSIYRYVYKIGSSNIQHCSRLIYYVFTVPVVGTCFAWNYITQFLMWVWVRICYTQVPIDMYLYLHLVLQHYII